VSLHERLSWFAPDATTAELREAPDRSGAVAA
jgi:hypothetical protein